MDWSHGLLGQKERALFRRLSIFAGGFSLEAAESVCAGGEFQRDEVLGLLSSLVDKSLVTTRETGGETRYRLLEMVGQYAGEKLDGAEEAADVGRRHTNFYMELAEEAEPELKGERQLAWLERLETEHDNLRAAMRWLLARGESEEAARLGWALWLFWGIRAHFAEGRRSMEQALSAEGGLAMSESTRARALYVEGMMENYQGDHRSAELLVEESLRLFRELDDKLGTAYALSNAGFAALGQGQPQRAITLTEEAVDLFLEEGEKWGAAIELGFLAVAWRDQSDHERAKRLAERALALSRDVGERQAISVALNTLATLAQAEHDHERARELFGEGLTVSAELENESDVVHCLEGLASIAAAEGKIVRAARLWGAAEALLEDIEFGVHTYVPDRSVHQRQVAAARTRLDEEAFEAAWAEGRTMTPEQAIEYALEQEAAPEAAAIPETYPAELSTREVEVLCLVAAGLTNAEVAEKLFLSSRTVDWHMGSIYRKLGLHSRAEATRFAAEHGLL
jgi:non-specific serine/threonine protein kinase